MFESDLFREKLAVVRREINGILLRNDCYIIPTPLSLPHCIEYSSVV